MACNLALIFKPNAPNHDQIWIKQFNSQISINNTQMPQSHQEEQKIRQLSEAPFKVPINQEIRVIVDTRPSIEITMDQKWQFNKIKGAIISKEPILIQGSSLWACVISKRVVMQYHWAQRLETSIKSTLNMTNCYRRARRKCQAKWSNLNIRGASKPNLTYPSTFQSNWMKNNPFFRLLFSKRSKKWITITRVDPATRKLLLIHPLPLRRTPLRCLVFNKIGQTAL